jgi:hypothetical protein
MPNLISQDLLAQFYGASSNDPLLMLLTLSHPSFTTLRLVNNTEDVTSRGEVYQAFPMNIRTPSDDGESVREATIEFDNASLELMDEFRAVTTPIDAKLEIVLFSDLDTVQLSYEELKIRSISYDKNKVSARLYMDDFLNIELTSEKYTPTNFPGLF